MGTQGAVAAWRIVPETAPAGGFTLTKDTRLVVAAGQEGCSIPLAVLAHLQRVAITRIWVPVLQVPNLLGARVTVAATIHLPLPTVWEASGVPAWRQAPWEVVVHRQAREVLRFALGVGRGYRMGHLRAVPRVASKLSCQDNPPMGGFVSTARGTGFTRPPASQTRRWSFWGESVAVHTGYVLSAYARTVGLMLYSNPTNWDDMFLQRTHASGEILPGC